MLQVPSQFPYPGSTALFQGLRWRIQQLMGENALLTREGEGSSPARRAPVIELVDPIEADANDVIGMTNVSESTARIAIFATTLLRDRNEIALRDLGALLTEHAQAGRIPKHRDNSHLVRIMRGLGWRKDGYTGERFERSPLYRRAAAPTG